MNKLNTARVRLGMAAEYLHTDLNAFNDAVMYVVIKVTSEQVLGPRVSNRREA